MTTTCPSWCDQRADPAHDPSGDAAELVGTWTHQAGIGLATLADGRQVVAELSRVDELDEDGTATPGRTRVWLGGLEENPSFGTDDLLALGQLLSTARQRLAQVTAQ
ncbi:MAG: hypothetical protein QM779_08215 [Propionicimonas sp.]|uniref:hypothetical protein n=1 Tax=Propionicimonas sp. TaxID=1955623 RepID=UPI003D10D7EF